MWEFKRGPQKFLQQSEHSEAGLKDLEDKCSKETTKFKIILSIRGSHEVCK